MVETGLAIVSVRARCITWARKISDGRLFLHDRPLGQQRFRHDTTTFRMIPLHGPRPKIIPPIRRRLQVAHVMRHEILVHRVRRHVVETDARRTTTASSVVDRGRRRRHTRRHKGVGWRDRYEAIRRRRSLWVDHDSHPVQIDVMFERLIDLVRFVLVLVLVVCIVRFVILGSVRFRRFVRLEDRRRLETPTST